MVKSLDNFKFFTFNSRAYAVNIKTQEIHFVDSGNVLSGALPNHPVFLQVRKIAAEQTA